MNNAERVAEAKNAAEGWEFDMAIEATEQIVDSIYETTREVVETNSERYNRILVEELEILGLL